MTCSCHRSPPALTPDGTLPPQSRSTFAPGAGPGRQERETLTTHPWSKVKAPLAGPGASRHSQISRSRTSPAPGSAARDRGSSRGRSPWLSSRRQRKSWLPWERQSNPASLLLNWIVKLNVSQRVWWPGACPALGHSREAGAAELGESPDGEGGTGRSWGGNHGRASLAAGFRGQENLRDTQHGAILSSPAASPQPWNKLLHQQQESWELTCLCW